MAFRVLFLIDKMTQGGAQRHVAIMSRLLYDKGFDVGICCLDREGDWGRELKSYGIKVESLGYSSILPPSGAGLFLRLRNYIREVKPDVLHCLLFSASVVGPLAAKASGCGCKILCARRDTGFWLKPWHVWALKFSSSFAGGLCANSRAVAKSRSALEGVPVKRYGVVHNSVPSEIFTAAKAKRVELGLSDNDFVVTSVARLRPEKGQRALVRAAGIMKNSCPGLKVLLVGDGPEEEALRRFVSENGLDDVVCFLGARDDVPDILASSDVAALLSDSEGFSNFIIEAMAAGLPVVASRVGGNVEAVVDGKTGFLVDANDADTVAGKILALHSDSQMCSSMGAAALGVAKTEYSCAREAEQYIAIYENLLAGRRVTDGLQSDGDGVVK